MLAITMIACMPNMVSASVVNDNGIVMSDEEYNNFLKVHTHEYLMVMNQEKYETLKSLDYNTVKSDTKYVETAYNSELNITTSKEITEEEYNHAGAISTYGGTDGIETQYKRLNLTVTDSGNYSYITNTCTWKMIPSTRSFDVNAIRVANYSIIDGTQDGLQQYTLNGSNKYVAYSWNGTNIKKASNGFGISMNIVNSTVSYLQSTISARATKGSSTRAVYGTYVHATTDVSLATSQSYTISSSGLGYVLNFPYNIMQKYDNMGGVEV